MQLLCVSLINLYGCQIKQAIAAILSFNCHTARDHELKSRLGRNLINHYIPTKTTPIYLRSLPCDNYYLNCEKWSPFYVIESQQFNQKSRNSFEKDHINCNGWIFLHSTPPTWSNILLFSFQLRSLDLLTSKTCLLSWQHPPPVPNLSSKCYPYYVTDNWCKSQLSSAY